MFYSALLAATVGLGVFFDHTAAQTVPEPEVRQVAQWAVDSRDHAGLPFVVVDKARARLFAFDALGRLLGSGPVLLGTMHADAPVVPATPAGRFVSDTWRPAPGDAIVWVNGDTSVLLYAAPSPTSPGRAAQRLASDEIEDKRISDGSLYVASDFYKDYLAPLKGQASIAYVLPELTPAARLFDSHADGEGRFVALSRAQPPARRPS